MMPDEEIGTTFFAVSEIESCAEIILITQICLSYSFNNDNKMWDSKVTYKVFLLYIKNLLLVT